MCPRHKTTAGVLNIPVILYISLALFGRYQKCLLIFDLSYYTKFLRHVYLAILGCTHFGELKFRNFANILYFVALFEKHTIKFLGNVICPFLGSKPTLI